MAIRKQVKEVAQKFTNEPLKLKTDSGVVMALISTIRELNRENERLKKIIDENIISMF